MFSTVTHVVPVHPQIRPKQGLLLPSSGTNDLSHVFKLLNPFVSNDLVGLGGTLLIGFWLRLMRELTGYVHVLSLYFYFHR